MISHTIGLIILVIVVIAACAVALSSLIIKNNNDYIRRKYYFEKDGLLKLLKEYKEQEWFADLSGHTSGLKMIEEYKVKVAYLEHIMLERKIDY